MNTESLLRAVRPVHVLFPRPGQSGSAEPKFWSIQLDGLHQNHLKASANRLRDDRKRRGQPISDDVSLKLSGLHYGIAKALGARSFDAWCNSEQNLVEFLLANGMTQPADLIHWSLSPLTARQVSDRLFNSDLPLPKRIFTGVGSNLFVARGRGRIDIFGLSGRHMSEEGILEWCEARVGGDGKGGGATSHRHPEACSGGGSLRFRKELIWRKNAEGLPFLSVVDFGEWLADYAHGHAPVANAATGRALMTGALDRDRCPAHLTMRYKGLKVGFRICYVAQFDA